MRALGERQEARTSRENLGTVLVEALLSDEALGKTFEAFSGPGASPDDWSAVFTSLHTDTPGAIDAYTDTPNLPLEDEPPTVRDDLTTLRTT